MASPTPSDDTLVIPDEFKDDVGQLVREVGMLAEDALQQLMEGKTVVQIAMRAERMKYKTEIKRLEKERVKMEMERDEERHKLEEREAAISKERDLLAEMERAERKQRDADLGPDVRRKVRTPKVKKEEPWGPPADAKELLMDIDPKSTTLMDVVNSVRQEVEEVRGNLRDGRERSRSRRSVAFRPRSPSAETMPSSTPTTAWTWRTTTKSTLPPGRRAQAEVEAEALVAGQM